MEKNGDKKIIPFDIEKQPKKIKQEAVNELSKRAGLTEAKPEEDEFLKTMAIKDYKKYKSSKDYLIKGIKFTKESELVVAPSRNFKTIMNQYQACCIASGRSYLGFKTKKEAVLYVSAETSIEQDKDILLKILKGLKIRSNKIPLYILPRCECGDLFDVKFVAKIYNTIKKYSIKVIYMDTINPLTPSIDDNSGRDVTQLFNDFIKPICDLGLNLTFLHHTGKNEETYLGSVKWFANTDNVFRFDREELDNRLTIFNEKCRRGEGDTLDVEISFGPEKIIFNLLGKRQPMIFNKFRKVTKSNFLISKLNDIATKNMERKEILELFTAKGVKYTIPTLDRAIGIWKRSKQ